MIKVSGGYNNWWTLTLDMKLSPEPSVFTVDLHPDKTVKQMSFQEAADYTAQRISQDYSNLYVSLGGGLDSEFVATVLLRNNIPFRPIVAHLKNSNNLDFHYALDWCDKNIIDPILLEYKLDDPRLIKQAMALAKKYCLDRPRAAMLMDVLEYIDEQGGSALTGDPSIGYTDLDENFYQGIGDEFGIWPIELMSSILRLNHPGAFFFYTPEIVLAQAHELDTTLNDSRSRTKLYQIPFRPKTWPPRGLSDETRLKVKQIFDIHKYTVPQNYKWNKEDLIKIFTH